MAAKDIWEGVYGRPQLSRIEQNQNGWTHSVPQSFGNTTNNCSSNRRDNEDNDNLHNLSDPNDSDDTTQQNINNTNLANIMLKPFIASNDQEQSNDNNSQETNAQDNTVEYSTTQEQTANSSRSRRKKFNLNTLGDCEYILPQFNGRGFHPKQNQIFLLNYQFDIRSDKDIEPFPHPKKSVGVTDFWDDRHVKMPNSLRNQRKAPPGFFSNSAYTMIPSWKIITKALKKDLNTFQKLEESIKKYNNYQNLNFEVLQEFIERSNFPNISDTLKGMAKLALKLPEVVTQSPPLLRQKANMTLFLTHKQISCLLANAFFCTFPRRSRPNAEYKNYPSFNFFSLFSSRDPNKKQIKLEKLKCIFNYFQRLAQEKPNGIVSFERRYLDKTPEWHRSDKTLRKLQIEESGTIEKEGRKFSEMQFANSLIGGGVLNSGTLQEELRLLMSPELIVSRLFTEQLLDNEALVINGSEQYNLLIGYGNTFKWDGDLRVRPQRDVWNRYNTEIIAIDAEEWPTRNKNEQFDQKFIDRALNKAFSGFKTVIKYKNDKIPAIASGKWGCGGFNGDPFLSCLIQYMAASFADRDLILFIKNDRELVDKLEYFRDFSYQKKLKIKNLYRVLTSFQYESQNIKDNINIIDYICSKISD